MIKLFINNIKLFILLTFIGTLTGFIVTNFKMSYWEKSLTLRVGFYENKRLQEKDVLIQDIFILESELIKNNTHITLLPREDRYGMLVIKIRADSKGEVVDISQKVSSHLLSRHTKIYNYHFNKLQTRISSLDREIKRYKQELEQFKSLDLLQIRGKSADLVCSSLLVQSLRSMISSLGKEKQKLEENISDNNTFPTKLIYETDPLKFPSAIHFFLNIVSGVFLLNALGFIYLNYRNSAKI